jgi:hypothetical protein
MKYFVIIFLLVSCSSVRHWKKVATDVDVTPYKKSLIAPKMAVLFPPQVKHVPGETVVKVDTVINERYEVIRDTVTGVDTVVKYRERTVTKEVRIVDTVFQVDAATLYATQQELAVCGSNNAALRADNTQLTTTANKAVKRRNTWLWAFIGACVALAGSIYLLFKR